MRTRKVSVYVFSYPEDFNSTLSYKRLLEIHEVAEFSDKFLSSQSLETILREYIDKVDVYASFIDEIRWYRIVVRDSERRIIYIYQA